MKAGNQTDIGNEAKVGTITFTTKTCKKHRHKNGTAATIGNKVGNTKASSMAIGSASQHSQIIHRHKYWRTPVTRRRSG